MKDDIRSGMMERRVEGTRVKVRLRIKGVKKDLREKRLGGGQ